MMMKLFVKLCVKANPSFSTVSNGKSWSLGGYGEMLGCDIYVVEEVEMPVPKLLQVSR